MEMLNWHSIVWWNSRLCFCKRHNQCNTLSKIHVENYYDGIDSIKPLNWEMILIWNKNDYPDEHYVEVMVVLSI